jgi:nucleoside H+ symporter
MLIGFSVVGAITDKFLLNGQHDWYHIWIYPAGFAAAVMILFALLFKEEKITYEGRK